MDFPQFAGKIKNVNALVEAEMDVEVGAVVIEEPAVSTRTRTKRGDAAGDWLCAWCLNRVASEKARFAYQGETEFAFKNPNGILFQIITFSETTGCREDGIPTLEATWFPAHAWSYCVCDRCRAHLGWFYSGPSEFVGLIRDRIVRASLVRN